ncbi:hypothetical protein ACR77J_07700 [Tissierella praeacuta]
MKTFKVVVQIRGQETYYVEAETPEKALEMVEAGDVKYDEQIIEDT